MWNWGRKIWSRFQSTYKRDQQKEQQQDIDPISSEFREEVKTATALLSFLLREGTGDHIPDQVIDEIEEAQEYVKHSTVPTKEQRAKFIKAYQNLVNTPRYSVKYINIPPTPFWSASSLWPLSLMLISIIPTIVGFFLFKWYWPVLYVLPSATAIIGLYLFTGVVTDRKLNLIIRFCFLFTGVSLLIASLPFCIPSLFSQLSQESPIGVIRGCGTQQDDFLPKEIVCDNAAAYQWVVRIGGAATPLEPQTPRKPAAPTTPPPAPAQGSTAPTTPPPTSPVYYSISGGMVVPLYVIILALFGSAVSMTRRVPEYQGRAMDSQDPLTNVQARGYLIFQIMQVISAPLIAVTAYYVVKPATPLTSVVLGFGSGFASEPILLMIRSLVEKLSPAHPTEASAVSVTVGPPSVILQPKQAQQFTAKVSGSPRADVTWSIDPADAAAGTISQSGFYIAPDAPPTRAVTITARSAADPTKSGSASVKVEPTTVKVTPRSVNLHPTQEQQFSAEVSGSSNTAVTWSIDPSDASAGTISTSGKYTTPQSITSAKTVKVIAKSKADSTKTDSATVVLDLNPSAD